MGSVRYIEEEKNPDIIFIEGQSSLTEMGNPHPRGLSASILIGAMPDVTVLCHRPNHPYRKPRGIKEEIRAIEALEPTRVIAISLNLRNINDRSIMEEYENRFGLPVVDVKNGGASRLMDVIMDYIGEI